MPKNQLKQFCSSTNVNRSSFFQSNLRHVALSLIIFLAPLCNLRAQGMPFNGNGMVHAQGGGGGTITLGAHTCAGSTGGADITSSAINTSGASLLVMFVASYSAVALPTITDSKGNTWTPRTRYGPGTALSSSAFFYAENPMVGSGHTFTATGPGVNDFPQICIIAFSGTATSSVYDTENGNNGSTGASSIQPGSVTPSQNNEVVVTGFTSINTMTAGINGGFTISDQASNVPSQHFGGGIAYLIQTSAAAANPTWTLGETVDVSASIATFKAP